MEEVKDLSEVVTAIRNVVHAIRISESMDVYENDELGTEYLLLGVAALDQARCYFRLAEKLTKR